MLKNLFHILCCTLLLCISHSICAQPIYQDCVGAIPICQNVYSTSSYTSGNGVHSEVDESSSPCALTEDNATWYTFTAQTSGNLGFLITPNDLVDDYDWGLWDMTGISCSQLNSSAAFASCNTAGSVPGDGTNCNGITGCNGTTANNTADPGCEPGNSPFNAFVPVTTGHTYVLMINNWTGSTSGYTIDFSASTASIFDNTKPTVINPNAALCPGSNDILLKTSEKIKVSTLSSDGSEFTISGPAPIAIYSAANNDAASPYYSNSISISIGTVTVPGTYTLHISNGNDGNTFSDVCDNFLNPISLDILVYPSYQVEIGVEKTSLCEDASNTLYNLTSLPPEYSGITYKWTDNGTLIGSTFAPPSCPITAGEHHIQLEISTLECGTSKASTQYSVYNYPVFTLPSSYLVCTGNEVELSADKGYTGVTYEWNNGSTSATTTYDNTMDYAICVANNHGCTYTDQTDILDDCIFFLPSAFSPNDDELNDIYYFYSKIPVTGVMRIYDRWGNKVFETSDLTQGWDGTFNGKALNTGVYVCYVLLNDVALGEDIKGNITLLR